MISWKQWLARILDIAVVREPLLPIAIIRDLKPTDRVMFVFNRRLSPTECKRIRETWDAQWPKGEGPRVIVIEDIATIRIDRRPESAA